MPKAFRQMRALMPTGLRTKGTTLAEVLAEYLTLRCSMLTSLPHSSLGSCLSLSPWIQEGEAKVVKGKCLPGQKIASNATFPSYIINLPYVETPRVSCLLH